MQSVAIVGANGFIGNALAKALSHSGCNIIAITRNSVIMDVDVDIVFYVAGSSTPYNAEAEINNIESDLNNLKQFLVQLKSAKHRPLFVFMSSAGTVYDPEDVQPYTESSRLLPVNKYGRSKLKFESIIRQAEWVSPLILRLSNIYGPYQTPKPGFGVIAHWAKKFFNEEPIEIIGNSKRDYLYISDLADIAIKIVKERKSEYDGLIVNIGSGATVSLEELYQTFISVADLPIKAIRKPAREFDVKSVSLDVSLAKEIFEWQPKIPLHMGIKGVLQAVRTTQAEKLT